MSGDVPLAAAKENDTMKLQTSVDLFGVRRVVLECTEHEITDLALNYYDMRLLRECEASEKVSDKLLALQLIAKRMEQHQARAASDLPATT